MERYLLWYFELPASPNQLGEWKLHFPGHSSPAFFYLICSLIGVCFIYCVARYLIGGKSNRSKWASLSTLVTFVLFGCLLLVACGTTLSYVSRSRPTFVNFVDVSRSMDTTDIVLDRRSRRFRERLTKKKLESTSRIELVQAAITSDIWKDQLANSDQRFVEIAESAAEIERLQPHRRNRKTGDTTTKQLIADGTESRLPESMIQFLQEQSTEQVSGIVVWTDGRIVPGTSNTWDELASFLFARRVPMYAIGIGEERETIDASLHAMVAPDEVFPGEQVTIAGKVQIEGAVEPQTLPITLRNADSMEVLDQTSVDLSPEQNDLAFRLQTSSLQVGENRVRVEVERPFGDLRAENNTWETNIAVVSEPFRVLLLSATPGFEFRYLRQMLDREPEINANVLLSSADTRAVQQSSAMIDRLPTRDAIIQEYQLLIAFESQLNQINRREQETVQNFVTGGGSIVIISDEASESTNPRSEWRGLLIGSGQTESRPMKESLQFRNATELRITDDGIRSQLLNRIEEITVNSSNDLKQLPLHPVFRVADSSNNRKEALVLLETDEAPARPAMTLHRIGLGIVVWLGTDETWRWRTANGSQWYRNFWMQFLPTLASASRSNTTKEDLLTTDRETYNTGELISVRVRLGARHQNSIAAGSHVTASLYRKGEFVRSLALHREREVSNWYSAETAIHEPGIFEVYCNPDNSPQGTTALKAQFRVTSEQKELSNVTASHESLRRAAEKSGGRFFRFEDFAQIGQVMKPRDSQTTGSRRIPLWNRWELLALIVCLYSIENVIRTRSRR